VPHVNKAIITPAGPYQWYIISMLEQQKGSRRLHTITSVPNLDMFAVEVQRRVMRGRTLKCFGITGCSGRIERVGGGELLST
jgi:hypothetical protein